MEGKKDDTKIDWKALDEHWEEQYKNEFGHFFISPIK